MADKKKLTPKQQKFVQEYIKLGNATQAYIAAGYICNYKTATVKSSLLVAKDSVREEITKIRNEEFKKNVATSEEVMDFFSRVMRGEVKDQFGLETSVADRIKAGQELAKRTIDIDNKKLGLGDNLLEIRLDWSRPALRTDQGQDRPRISGTAVQEAEWSVVEPDIQ